jgi:hypothetical protein
MLPVINPARISVTNSAVFPDINPARISVTNSAVFPVINPARISVTNSAVFPVINPAGIPVINSALFPVNYLAGIPVINSAGIINSAVVNPAGIAAFGEYARATSMASCVRVFQVATPAVQRDGTQMQPGPDREQAAPQAPGSLVALAAPVPSGKQNRGNRTVRPGTVAAALALGFWINNHSFNPKPLPPPWHSSRRILRRGRGLKGQICWTLEAAPCSPWLRRSSMPGRQHQRLPLKIRRLPLTKRGLPRSFAGGVR